MRVLSAIVAVCLALLSFACGGDDPATGSGETDSTSANGPDRPQPRFPSGTTEADPHFATITFGKGERGEPRIDPPDLPPPKRLMVRDLEVGTGPVAYRGDEVGVWYLAVNYETGRQTYFRWPPTASPWDLRLGDGGSGIAWEEGIEGMRVGGRREILIPARRMYGAGPTDYLVHLVRVEPASKAGRGG